jgi:microcystin-dependent protein
MSIFKNGLEDYNTSGLVNYADAFKNTVLRGSMDYIAGTFTTPHDCTFESTVTVNDDVEIKGNLTCRGNITQIDLTDMTSEQLSITNNGTGPALVVNQIGPEDVMNIQDDGTSALIVKDGGNVGINTTTPAYKLDVNGTSNATSVFQASALLVPTGSIMAFISTSAPSGWLICDGSAVSRTTYSALFAIIGTTFGVGDGVNTFNLPNTQGRMLVAYNSADTNFDSIGETGGNKNVTLTTNELPAHTHTGTTNSNGSHTHTFEMSKDDDNGSHNNGQYPVGDANEGPGTDTYYVNTGSAGAHTHTFTTNSTGSGNSFSILNPYFTVTYIIKF